MVYVVAGQLCFSLRRYYGWQQRHRQCCGVKQGLGYGVPGVSPETIMVGFGLCQRDSRIGGPEHWDCHGRF